MKYANLGYAITDNNELIKLDKIGASKLAIKIYLFLKMNINVDDGQLKSKIGKDKLNYNTIAKRFEATPNGVKKAIQFLNEHDMIRTSVVEIIYGKITFVSEFRKDNNDE